MVDTAETIMGFEGYRSTPYYDRNAWRIGYGSDTVTDANGNVSRVTRDMTTTRSAATRDLNRRIPEFQNQGIIPYVGQDAWDNLSAGQRAAITSLGYNYGSISHLPSLQRAIRSGDSEQIAQAIRNRAVDNGGENASRRRAEAQLASGTPTPPGGIQETAVGTELDVQKMGDSVGAVTPYTIKAGDNLIKIAKNYNTTVEKLSALNGISNPNKIIAGQKLVIPTSGISGLPDTQQTPQIQLQKTGRITAALSAGAAAAHQSRVDDVSALTLQAQRSEQASMRKAAKPASKLSDPNQIDVNNLLPMPRTSIKPVTTTTEGPDGFAMLRGNVLGFIGDKLNATKDGALAGVDQIKTIAVKKAPVLSKTIQDDMFSAVVGTVAGRSAFIDPKIASIFTNQPVGTAARNVAARQAATQQRLAAAKSGSKSGNGGAIALPTPAPTNSKSGNGSGPGSAANGTLKAYQQNAMNVDAHGNWLG